MIPPLIIMPRSDWRMTLFGHRIGPYWSFCDTSTLDVTGETEYLERVKKPIASAQETGNIAFVICQVCGFQLSEHATQEHTLVPQKAGSRLSFWIDSQEDQHVVVVKNDRRTGLVFAECDVCDWTYASRIRSSVIEAVGKHIDDGNSGKRG